MYPHVKQAYFQKLWMLVFIWSTWEPKLYPRRQTGHRQPLKGLTESVIVTHPFQNNFYLKSMADSWVCSLYKSWVWYGGSRKKCNYRELGNTLKMLLQNLTPDISQEFDTNTLLYTAQTSINRWTKFLVPPIA